MTGSKKNESSKWMVIEDDRYPWFCWLYAITSSIKYITTPRTIITTPRAMIPCDAPKIASVILPPKAAKNPRNWSTSYEKYCKLLHTQIKS